MLRAGNLKIKILFALVFFLWATTALAQSQYSDFFSLTCGSGEPTGPGKIASCIKKLAETAVKLALPVATVFIIFAGFLFVTAQGSENKLVQAKQTLTWTLIGLAITVGAWTLAIAFHNFFSQL